MSSVAISGNASGAGVLTIAAPNTASNYTLTLPTATTTLVGTDATQTLTNKTLTSPTITGAAVSSMASSVITSGTAVASTSGTSIDFTSIPSWVKRITVMLDGVSTSGTSFFLFQVGSGSISSSGYTGGGGRYNFSNTTVGASSTAGLYFSGPFAAADTAIGQIVATLVTGNTWVITSITYFSSSLYMNTNATRIALGGSLDRVRLTTTNGTDTFDAGSINILYE